MNEREKNIFKEELTYIRRDWSFSRILKESREENWEYRSFNNEYTWTLQKATFFIESIILRCELQPLIIFKHHDQQTICDGYQRLITLTKFFNNEFALSEHGLHQLTYLKNKRFKDLPEEFQNYLQHDCTFRVEIYQIQNSSENLSLEDFHSLERQLYIRYNTGIQLKNFQIQKAQFYDEEITKYLHEKMNNDKEFYEKLVTLKIINPQRHKNAIDYALVKIRELIASTDYPLNNYLSLKSSQAIVSKAYLTTITNKKPKEIINLFENTIDQLYKIYTHKDFKKGNNLDNYRFTEVSYWLLATITKDYLLKNETLDIEKYIDYCINHDLYNNSHFSHVLGINIQNKRERFRFATHFLERYYSIKMDSYFEKNDIDLKKQENVEKIPTLEELKKRQFKVSYGDLDVESLCTLMKEKRFILRPPYQRGEEKKIIEASALIESSFLNIHIPDILVYRYHKDGQDIYEVVDGQQRCLTLLAYCGYPYLDEFGVHQKSEKHNFALQKLRICEECNGATYNESKKQLEKVYRDKLKNFDIHLSIIDADSNPHFEAVDHYIRINANINVIKRHSYVYWNVAYDQPIMRRINEITKKHLKAQLFTPTILKSNEHIVTLCAYQDFRAQRRLLADTFWHKVKNSRISYWLDSINDQNRKAYFLSLQKVDITFQIWEKWLEKLSKTPNELFCLRENSKITTRKFDLLFYLLKDFNEDILLKKAASIYEIVNNFYSDLKKLNAKKLDITIEELITKTKEKLKMLQIDFLAEKSYS